MIKIKKIHELEEAAKEFLEIHKDKTIFAFHGDMGVGKTTFIKAICSELGSLDNVTSPTFSIINEYQAKNNKTLYHFDFYRIISMEEVFDLGYEEYFYSGNYCFIEWPGKIVNLLPENTLSLLIEEMEDGERIISWTKINV